MNNKRNLVLSIDGKKIDMPLGESLSLEQSKHKGFDLNQVAKYLLFIPKENDIEIRTGDKMKLNNETICDVVSVDILENGKNVECVPVCSGAFLTK